jgi:VWFA-related protein
LLIDTGLDVDGTFTPFQPLHPVSRSSATVLYRNGAEVVDTGVTTTRKSEQDSPGLTTSGEFGPIFGTVLGDASQGKLAWSHWEQGSNGLEAVFSLVVPREKSHFDVEFCCVPSETGNRVFKRFVGYHGEIAVDASNGSILRLTLIADLTKADPLVKADMMVEYGPVEIGDRKYICPIKSVSISLAPAQTKKVLLFETQASSLIQREDAMNRAPLQTMLNDVAFGQYHLFRTDARIVAGDDQQSPGNSSAIAGASPANLPGSVAKTEEPAVLGSHVSAGPVEGSAAVEPATLPSAIVQTPSPPPAPVLPEIAVTGPAALPGTLSVPDATQNKAFTLRVTTRLVDVDVVALDRKGHPVAGLKPEDFEIYDNGRRQSVQFFTEAGGASAVQTAAAPGQPVSSPGQLVFSNRMGMTADAKPGPGGTEGSVIILLIDANNLAWADLTRARAQMLKFLQKLTPGERVGIYVQTARRFQILVEATTDRTLLASTLSEWMPNAGDLARARQEEQRNREQFDWVENPDDLQYVNGTMNTAPDTASTIDPELRDFGSNPARSALTILVGVARHLAAIPGHKNLVWVASDNVLADWADRAVGTDKGSQHIDDFVLRAQDELNDAHVSIFPLDASQLETMAVDPSLENPSVDLSPSVTAPPQHQGGMAGPGLGRSAAEMQQDNHAIQGPIQKLAESTGGRVLRRSSNIQAALNGVVEDGRATYLLGFVPDSPADDQYHVLTVQLTTRRDIKLRYRTGYQYTREPTILKDRFRQVMWQPLDASEIGLSAQKVAASEGTALKLSIAASDLDLKQQGGLWSDTLDIFLVRRDDTGLSAKVSGQTLRLLLKPATYNRLLGEGIDFDQFVPADRKGGSVRIVVVDENSGRMGSVTLPGLSQQGSL